MTTRRPGSDPRPSQRSEVQGSRLSALKNPVGPNDRSVYVRRRIIVLLGVIAAVAAIALMIIRPGSSSGDAGNVKTVEIPEEVIETSTPTDGEAEDAISACETRQLQVEAITDQTSYGDGEIPKLSLSVTNTGDDTCIADLGTSDMTFTVTSGTDEVWRSTDCQTARESLPVELAAGETLESETVDWDRTRSSTETCEITRDPVGGGGASYHLSVSIAGVKSETSAQFLLY